MPAKQMPRKKGYQNKDILEGKPIQQGTEEWIALGSKLLQESIGVAREYSRFMIQFSFGAVPVYIALLELVKGDIVFKTAAISVPYLILLSLPINLFLISSIIFIVAYYPKKGEVLVGAVEDIQRAHQQLMTGRRKINIIGTITFILSVVASAIILIVTF